MNVILSVGVFVVAMHAYVVDKAIQRLEQKLVCIPAPKAAVPVVPNKKVM